MDDDDLLLGVYCSSESALRDAKEPNDHVTRVTPPFSFCACGDFFDTRYLALEHVTPLDLPRPGKSTRRIILVVRPGALSGLIPLPPTGELIFWRTDQLSRLFFASPSFSLSIISLSDRIWGREMMIDAFSPSDPLLASLSLCMNTTLGGPPPRVVARLSSVALEISTTFLASTSLSPLFRDFLNNKHLPCYCLSPIRIFFMVLPLVFPL